MDIMKRATTPSEAETTTLVRLRAPVRIAKPIRNGGECDFVSEVIHTRATPLIAIVDDDEDVRIALAELVESIGYAATVFASADAFLARPGGREADCVISDVHMPGTSGLKLARSVQHQGIPVILITAFPSPDLEKQAQDAGVLCFLRKPFDPTILIDRLAALLD